MRWMGVMKTMVDKSIWKITWCCFGGLTHRSISN